MSMFTRLTDSDTLHPIMVFGPLEAEHTVRTISRELLHSTATRTTFVPGTQRAGTYQCLFPTHAEARAAAEWFGAASLYGFTAEFINPGGWGWVDGYYLNAPASPDTSFDATFVVVGDRIEIVQDQGKWQVIVPYKEIS